MNNDSRTKARRPFTSIVTPFFNTADYLEQCIESVLKQTHQDFEYLLVDNKSTDGSDEIAARYARLDSRVRFLRNEKFVSQMDNYNGALSQISPAAAYVKLVSADDVIFPHCVEYLVDAAEEHPTAGMASSYFLYGDHIYGDGISYERTLVTGRDAGRSVLLNELSDAIGMSTRSWPIGSPTTVLYRADLVREREAFYPPSQYFADNMAALGIFRGSDLAYVHQVLSFLRFEDRAQSVSGGVHWYGPGIACGMLLLAKYGEAFLDQPELDWARGEVSRRYLGVLARGLIARRDEEFWKFHETVMSQAGLAIDRGAVRRRVPLELLKLLAHPVGTRRRFRELVARSSRR